MSEQYNAYCSDCGMKTEIGRNCEGFYKQFPNGNPWSFVMPSHEECKDAGIHTDAYNYGSPDFVTHLKRVDFHEFFQLDNSRLHN